MTRYSACSSLLVPSSPLVQLLSGFSAVTGIVDSADCAAFGSKSNAAKFFCAGGTGNNDGGCQRCQSTLLRDNLAAAS